MKIEDGKIHFETTGRVLDGAIFNSIGINPDLHISGGADYGFYEADHNYDTYDPADYDPWAVEERHELADYVIKLWTEFKNKII